MLRGLRVLLWMMLLTGIVYPLIVTGIAQILFKTKADGDLISAKGKQIGAALIAQKFTEEKYFWPRPSAIDYNPLPSGGSNLGATSAALKKAVDERAAFLMKAHGIEDPTKIPSELLFASGSGLDPHISPSAAFFQINRILKARNLEEKIGRESITKLINNLTEKRCLGFIGELRVNVLKLNLALDEA